MFQIPDSQMKYFTEQPLFYKGVIEDDKDPTQCNKYRVRIIGLDSETLSTDMLPWATVLNNVTSGVGFSNFYKKGQFVLVHLYQNLRNQPIIMGAIQEINNQNDDIKVFKDPSGIYPRDSYKGKPDTNTKATGDKYLQNYVFETETGHYVEIDDSKDDGRINIYHRTGSVITIDNDGNININCVKNQNENIKENLTIRVEGNTNISTEGDTSITTKGSTTIDTTGSTLIKGNNVTIQGSPLSLN